MDGQELRSLMEAVSQRVFVELEASGRHVHVTAEQAKALFGHPLTPQRPLSQPGQYLAQERVTVIGPKGEFRNVAVLGPERKEGQVEISLTDGKQLGIDAPVRLSGDVRNTPGAVLVGSQGRVTLPQGVIAAKRHTPHSLPGRYLAAAKIWRYQCHQGNSERSAAGCGCPDAGGRAQLPLPFYLERGNAA